MSPTTYLERRSELERYFDRTAVQAWARLTSDAPVSRIRATVRAGRDRMRATLLSMLPLDLKGRRVLDAGCGTGAMAAELARRGAQVLAVDLSATLVDLARERVGSTDGNGAIDPLEAGAIDFRAGDMTDPALGHFDYMVAMDSLIHYRTPDVVRVLAGLAQRCERSIVFTFAPSTPMLELMHGVGRLFPRSDRAPAIEPVAVKGLRAALSRDPGLRDWRPGRSERIASGFYTSQAQELLRG
jgi:magnesium-protoporphyrin O-methyltransferase